jgi:hypothetical protein
MSVIANKNLEYLVMYESLLRKPPQATNIRADVDFNSNETLPNSLRQTLQDGELSTQDPKVKSGENGFNLPKL